MLVAEMERRDLRRLERAGDILLEGDRLVRILADGGFDRLTPLEPGLFHHRRPCHRHQQQAERDDQHDRRSEEHTSELQSLMRISYAVFCLTKKNNINTTIP